MTLLSFLRKGLWVETKCGKHYPESVGEGRNRNPLCLTCSKSGCYVHYRHTNRKQLPSSCLGETAGTKVRRLARLKKPQRDRRQEAPNPNHLGSACCHGWGQKPAASGQPGRARKAGQGTALQEESWGLTIAGTPATSFKSCSVQCKQLQTAFPP